LNGGRIRGFNGTLSSEEAAKAGAGNSMTPMTKNEGSKKQKSFQSFLRAAVRFIIEK
jgi:hypothetical protein